MAVWLTVRTLQCAQCLAVACPFRNSQAPLDACPVGRWGRWLGGVDVSRETVGVMEISGPALWAELHRAVASVPLMDLPGWLERFAGRIPCADCRSHFRALFTAFPPDFGSLRAFFTWTVEAHNKVNARLNKPLMTIQDAESRWQPFIAPPG